MKTNTDPYASAVALFRQYKGLADKALAQVEPKQLFFTPDPETNSLATIMKHMAGNMLSRWTNFLHEDGEKSWRHRDREFELTAADTPETIIAYWEKGWACLFDALAQINGNDLGRVITIRGEAHSVLEAINRQIAHYSYHVGQIVFLAKLIRAAEWKTLSIARGQSDAYNQEMLKK